MNPENNLGNNLDNNGMNSSSLGSIPVNNDLGNVQPNPTSLEGQTLNDLSAIGVQSLQGNMANNAQPSSLEGMTLNSVINNYQPVQDAQPVENVTPAPASSEAPMTLNDAINASSPVQPETFVQAPVEPTIPVAPAMDNVVPDAPVMQPTIESAPVEPQINNDVLQPETLPVQDAVMPSVAPEVNVNPAPSVSEPTMPIPDAMPDLGYQSAVSTPVDYATPMSDFDQIGETPELDPKAKNKNKKGGKTLVFVLIMLLICALGGGAYYLINVKGILDKSSVKTKDLTVELGATLSEDINDYATFSNTSSSNCVQDLSKVDTSAVGTYEYVIKCGKDEYRGKITVSDNTAPSVVLSAKVYKASPENMPSPDEFIKSCSENDCSYSFTNESDVETALSSKGIKTIKITVSDANNNSQVVNVPVVVIEQDFHVGLLATKDVVSNEEYTIKEKVVVLYSDFTYLSYTMYDFQFNDKTIYVTNSKKTESDTLTISDYSGLPVFNDEDMRITLVSDASNNLIQGIYKDDREALLSVGYTPEVFAIDHISLIDF
ncbi:MAG: hypothetical protein J5634_02140 [Bacilli bacterium]|nr:hypothetical protein [Bacilli bacterium]